MKRRLRTRLPHRRCGQTLIEMLIVVTIMLIVLSMLCVMIGKLVHAVLHLTG